MTPRDPKSEFIRWPWQPTAASPSLIGQPFNVYSSLPTWLEHFGFNTTAARFSVASTFLFAQQPASQTSQ
jgi:hypothetical protein